MGEALKAASGQPTSLHIDSDRVADAIDVDGFSGVGVGFVVGLATGLVVITWTGKAWGARRAGWTGVERAMAQLLALPGFWLGGFAGGWAGAALLKAIHLRSFLGWYFLTAAGVTALCVCFPVGRFIIGMGMEIGQRESPDLKTARSRKKPHEPGKRT